MTDCDLEADEIKYDANDDETSSCPQITLELGCVIGRECPNCLREKIRHDCVEYEGCEWDTQSHDPKPYLVVPDFLPIQT